MGWKKLKFWFFNVPFEAYPMSSVIRVMGFRLKDPSCNAEMARVPFTAQHKIKTYGQKFNRYHREKRGVPKFPMMPTSSNIDENLIESNA